MQPTLTPYRYTDPGYWQEKYHYMYTPFEGAAFLEAYFAQRQAQREALAAAMPTSDYEAALVAALQRAFHGQATPTEPLLAERAYTVWPSEPGTGEVVTQELLKDLLHVALQGGAADHPTWQGWLEFLLKRFEVAKRIHDTYGSNLRPAGLACETLGNYACFAALFMWAYQGNPSSRYLNVVLKVHDLIGGRDSASFDPLTTALLSLSLEAEVTAIRTLLDEHQITL